MIKAIYCGLLVILLSACLTTPTAPTPTLETPEATQPPAPVVIPSPDPEPTRHMLTSYQLVEISARETGGTSIVCATLAAISSDKAYMRVTYVGGESIYAIAYRKDNRWTFPCVDVSGNETVAIEIVNYVNNLAKTSGEHLLHVEAGQEYSLFFAAILSEA